jgi:hypothetical protein
MSTFTAKLSDLLFTAHYVLNEDGLALRWMDRDASEPLTLAGEDDEEFLAPLYIKDQLVDVDAETGAVDVTDKGGNPVRLEFKMLRPITPHDIKEACGS